MVGMPCSMWDMRNVSSCSMVYGHHPGGPGRLFFFVLFGVYYWGEVTENWSRTSLEMLHDRAHLCKHFKARYKCLIFTICLDPNLHLLCWDRNVSLGVGGFRGHTWTNWKWAHFQAGWKTNHDLLNILLMEATPNNHLGCIKPRNNLPINWLAGILNHQQ